MEALLDHFHVVITTKKNVEQLKKLILQLAVRGKLSKQDPNDEPVSKLLERIKQEKENLINEKKIKMDSHLHLVQDENIPYELPNNWVWVYLGSVIELISGRDVPVSECNDKGIGIPYIMGASNMHANSLSIERWIEKPVVIGYKGDIILSVKGTVGKLFIQDIDEVNLSRQVMNLRVNNIVSKEYLKIYLEAYVKQLKDKSKGLIPGITREDILNAVFPIPPISEQKRIVAKIEELNKLCDQLLEEIENKNDNNSKLNKSISSKIQDYNNQAQLEDFKFAIENIDYLFCEHIDIKLFRNSILSLAIQGKLVPSDPNDEPASALLERIKVEREKLINEGKIKKQNILSEVNDDEVPYDLPRGWRWVRIGDFTSIKGGKRLPAGYTLLDTATSHIYIRVTDMKNDTIDDSDLKYLSDEVYEQIKDYIIESRDLYITIVGSTIGKVGIVPEEFNNMNLTENAARIIIHGVEKTFLLHMLKSSFMQEQFIDKTNQVGQPKLALIRLKSAVFPLPPLIEQIRISGKIDQLTTLFDELEKTLEKSKLESEMLMQAVIQSAFNSTERDDNVVNFPKDNTNDIEDWEIAARSDGEINSDTKAKIKNRTAELLNKLKQ